MDDQERKPQPERPHPAGKLPVLDGEQADERAGSDERLPTRDEIPASDPSPVSGLQHNLDEGEPRTDSATTMHSVDEIPSEAG